MSSVMDRVTEAATRAAAGPLADARLRPSFPRVAAQSPFPPGAGLEEHVARFRTELETLAGKVYGPLDAAGVADTVVELILAAGERGGADEPAARDPAPMVRASLPVLAWSEDAIGCPGLADRLRQAYIELVSGHVPNDEGHQGALETLATLEVGLSGAIAGLADTGSIVVASGPGRSRLASLLPPIHVAVLPLSRLYPTMHDWLADGGVELARETSNLVVITGSSRTSDIEMQLTLGMHGPKEVHVVLLRDREARSR